MRLRALLVPLISMVFAGNATCGGLMLELVKQQQVTGLSLARAWDGEITVLTFDGEPVRKAFSPAGSYWYEACFARGGRHLVGSTPKGMAVAELAAGGKLLETFDELRGGTHIACAPNGKAFALEAWNESTKANSVYLVTADRDVRLVSKTGRFPAWSPDEDALVYEDGGNVMRYDVGRQTSAKLTGGSLPSWPRRDQIVFYRKGKMTSIDPARAERGETRDLFRDDKALTPLRFAPDNAYAMYVRVGKGSLSCLEEKDIVVWRMQDGAKTKVHSVCKTTPYTYDWLPNRAVLESLPTITAE